MPSPKEGKKLSLSERALYGRKKIVKKKKKRERLVITLRPD